MTAIATMKHRAGGFTVIALMFFCVIRLPAQGLYWETETKDAMFGGETQTTKSYYMPRLFKQGMEARNEFMIYLLDQQTLIKADTRHLTYSTITVAEFEQRLKLLNTKRASDTTKATSSIEKTTAMNVEKTGAEKTINGYKCKGYEVQRNGKHFFQIWTTQDIAGYPAMRIDMEEFLVQNTRLTPGYGELLAKHIKKVDGFPIEIDNGTFTTTVTKLEARAIPLTEFVVPAGYTYLPPKPITGGKSTK